MRVGERAAVDVLHQLGQSLGEEGEVHLVPDVVLSPLEEIQQSLQEGAELWRGEETLLEDRKSTRLNSSH